MDKSGKHSTGAASVRVSDLLAQRPRPLNRKMLAPKALSQQLVPPERGAVRLVPLPEHAGVDDGTDATGGGGGGRLRRFWIGLTDLAFAQLDRRPAQSRSGRGARLVVVLVVATLVLGTVVASAVVLSPDHRVAPPATVATEPLHGAAALRPDLLDAQLRGVSPPPELRASPPQPGRPALPEDAARVVGILFERLPNRPAEAATMLDPTLAAPGFVPAWGRIREVHDVWIRSEGRDGAVRASAVLVGTDGARTKVDYRLIVHDRPQERVVAAVLVGMQRLSAQHTVDHDTG